jgi:hypothetical protein
MRIDREHTSRFPPFKNRDLFAVTPCLFGGIGLDLMAACRALDNLDTDRS